MELLERVQELRKDIELGLKTDVVEVSVELIKIETELKQLLIQRVSQQRKLFNAVLDFSEELPMCTEDYHRSELWEKYKALNCG